MTIRQITVVGGGLAALSAVRTLRKQGYDGEIAVVTSEPHHPYERPALTKDYLRGESDRSAVFTAGEDWFAHNDVEVRTGTTVTAVDVDAHRLTMADGRTADYSKLLLATGSTARTLDVPGSDLRGVHTLRTVDDAELIAADLAASMTAGGGRLVVIGDGWIGMEVAASARSLGMDVTVLGRGAAPLAKALGERLGGFYADLHRRNGVTVRTGVRVTGLAGAANRVTGVELAGGEVIPADVVVAGVGAVPNVGLAASAGLQLRSAEFGGGIAVDERLQTSHPDVFAAGDVASVPSACWGRPIRVEHWATALRTGPHAAKAMLGSDAAYRRIPYFYSDQFDTSMEYSGFVASADARMVISGDLDAASFAAFWVEGDRVSAGMSVNVPDATGRIDELIGADRAVGDDELAGFV